MVRRFSRAARERASQRISGRTAIVGLLGAVVVAVTGAGAAAAGKPWEGAVTPKQTAQAKAAGVAAAKAAGAKVELAQKTVGFVNFNGALSAAQRQQAALEEAVSAVGWKFVACDAQGNLAKFGTCGTSLLNQHVDFVVTPGVDASFMGSFLKNAKQRGVPVVNAGGSVAPSPLFAASYAADDTKVGTVLAQWLVKKLKPLGKEVHIVNATFPLGPYISMSNGLKKTIAGTNIKIVDSPVTNGTDPTGGTKQQTTSELQGDPSIKAIWINYGSSAPLGACEAIDSFPQFRGKTFPSRPMVLTRLAELDALRLIRTGCIGAVLDYPYPVDGWVAVDQLAEYVARQKKLSQAHTPKYGTFDYFDYTVVTKESLPPAGQYRAPAADVPTFFRTKWANEFTY